MVVDNFLQTLIFTAMEANPWSLAAADYGV
jgi:hypothetical protein